MKQRLMTKLKCAALAFAVGFTTAAQAEVFETKSDFSGAAWLTTGSAPGLKFLKNDGSQATSDGCEADTMFYVKCDDASTVTNDPAIVYSGTKPDAFSETALNNYLNLSTEGGTYNRLLKPGAHTYTPDSMEEDKHFVDETSVSIPSAGLYIDMLVKFADANLVVSLRENANETLAVFLDEDADSGKTNLCVRAKYWDVDGDNFTSTTKTFKLGGDNAYEPDKWYRLTVMAAKQLDNGTLTGFQVFIDGSYMPLAAGEATMSAAAITKYGIAGAEFADGTMFASLADDGTSKARLTAVGFQGTGAVTDFVATETMPQFLAASVVAEYLDENGKTRKTRALPVEASSSRVTWSAGWYVVNSTVTLQKGADCRGDVKLILADGAKLTANGSSDNNAGIGVTGNSNSFTVYGQSAGTGELKANGNANGAGIGGGGDESGSYITINGGTVTATGGDGGGSGIGSGAYGSAASNIYVADNILLKADGNNPPTTRILHASSTTDVASLLANKQYATAVESAFYYVSFDPAKFGTVTVISKGVTLASGSTSPLAVQGAEPSFENPVKVTWTGAGDYMESSWSLTSISGTTVSLKDNYLTLAAARIGDSKYVGFPEAVDVASGMKEACTITLVQDYKGGDEFEICNKNGVVITIDLNGKTITNNDTGSIIATSAVVIDGTAGIVNASDMGISAPGSLTIKVGTFNAKVGYDSTEANVTVPADSTAKFSVDKNTTEGECSLTAPDGYKFVKVDDDTYWQLAKCVIVDIGGGLSATVLEGGACTVTGSGELTKTQTDSLKEQGVTSLVIGAGVTGVGDGAFANWNKLKDVTIGNDVTSIESNAFFRCAYVTNIVIGANVAKVEPNAFDRCRSLESISFGSLAAAEAAQETYTIVARITMDGETPVVDSVPEVKIDGYTKTLKGKVHLTDSTWETVETPLSETPYHFFKYEYEEEPK